MAISVNKTGISSPDTLLKRMVLVSAISLIIVTYVLMYHGYSIGVQLNAPWIIRLAGYISDPAQLAYPYIVRIVSRNKLQPSSDQERAVITELIGQGFNIDGKHPKSGNTALIKAANRLDVETVKLLLTHGADPNKVNNFGLNAAIRVCGNDEDEALEIVRLLVEHGWDLGSETNGIVDCLEQARSHADAKAKNGFQTNYALVSYLDQLMGSEAYQ